MREYCRKLSVGFVVASQQAARIGNYHGLKDGAAATLDTAARKLHTRTQLETIVFSASRHSSGQSSFQRPGTTRLLDRHRPGPAWARDIQWSGAARVRDLRRPRKARVRDIQQLGTARVRDFQRPSTARVRDLQLPGTARVRDILRVGVDSDT